MWTVDNPYGNVLEYVARTAGLDDASQVAAFDLILTPSQGPGFFGDKGGSSRPRVRTICRVCIQAWWLWASGG